MLMFLTGTYGIGKSSIAQAIKMQFPYARHIEFDSIRHSMGAPKPGNPVIEDALNWRAYQRAYDTVREWESFPHLVILDSSGASDRFKYLRYALGDLPQILVRLRSSFPYALCAKKWGAEAYSQAQFEHIEKLVMALRPDHEIWVDGKSTDQLAREILHMIGLTSQV